ncbi:hypothetical protein ACIQOW_35370 [Kitasatospora sp. NPDC091335]|uniref:hypothetical protein n=1 Tax=Streptomycetaceae TaxID=2062 RepID=UPI0016620FB9|nr:hypothetical protein [Streptomyces sp. CBMA156]
MAEEFKIDMSRMKTVSKQLDECGNRMGAVAKSLENLGKGRQLGTERLDAACKGFEDHWHGGIGRMAKLAHGLREGLDASLDNYGENEKGTAKGLGAT